MNIYVGNLSRDVADDDLLQAFKEFGEVKSAAVLKDRYTGEARGFGFVEMPNKEEAEKAIQALNSKELKGRHMIVNEARPPKDKKRTGGGGGPRRNRPGGGGGGYRSW
jgi:RNA recognition motif-containing protein